MLGGTGKVTASRSGGIHTGTEPSNAKAVGENRGRERRGDGRSVPSVRGRTPAELATVSEARYEVKRSVTGFWKDWRVRGDRGTVADDRRVKMYLRFYALLVS